MKELIVVRALLGRSRVERQEASSEGGLKLGSVV